MKIEVYGYEAVICAVGLSDHPNDDGTFTTEFYPVDLLLALRTSDKMLEGHPFLDLEPEDDKPTVAVKDLRPRLIEKIKRETGRGKMVALKITQDRPPKAGKGKQWRRAQRQRQFISSNKKRERAGLLFIKGEDYLSQEDLHWIDTICRGGELYSEQLQEEIQAVKAIGEFFIRLKQVVDNNRHKKRERGKKKKLKRKERRQLERI